MLQARQPANQKRICFKPNNSSTSFVCLNNVPVLQTFSARTLLLGPPHLGRTRMGGAHNIIAFALSWAGAKMNAF